MNLTLIDVEWDVSNPEAPYHVFWSIFFAVPILPFSLTLYWVLAGLYIIGMVYLSQFTYGTKSGTANFSASPWWALAWCKSA
jgi:hypothetical protein